MNELGDFWQELFNDHVLYFFVGPASALSVLCLNLGLIGILYFIQEKDIKYVNKSFNIYYV